MQKVLNQQSDQISEMKEQMNDMYVMLVKLL